jgi:hypothetical protein
LIRSWSTLGRIALPELLRRLPGLRLAEGMPPERDRIFFARGFTHVWVEWDAVSS